MLIDCETCVMLDVACRDCVVTFLTVPGESAGRAEQGFTSAESRAVAVLAHSGLVKPLRLVSGDPRPA